MFCHFWSIIPRNCRKFPTKQKLTADRRTSRGRCPLGTRTQCREPWKIWGSLRMCISRSLERCPLSWSCSLGTSSIPQNAVPWVETVSLQKKGLNQYRCHSNIMGRNFQKFLYKKIIILLRGIMVRRCAGRKVRAQVADTAHPAIDGSDISSLSVIVWCHFHKEYILTVTTAS